MANMMIHNSFLLLFDVKSEGEWFHLNINEADFSVRVYSHLRFIMRELLHELFSPGNPKKWVHKPLFTKVGQIASVNAST